jgi:hypothetical protein
MPSAFQQATDGGSFADVERLIGRRVSTFISHHVGADLCLLDP